MPSSQTLTPATVPSRGRFDATVEMNRPLCREHYLLRFRVAGTFSPTRPGQFIQIGCRPPDAAIDTHTLLGREIEWSNGQWPALDQPEACAPMALLRRPFSIAGRGDDEHGTWLEIIHRVVGVGTQWLGQLEPGDAIDLIGPLGNAFTLPPGKSLGLLVGGGVGLPPMFYLAEAMRRANWDAVGFVGAMTRDLLAVSFVEDVQPPADGAPLLCVDEFARHRHPAVITTNDGSLGLMGFITDGLLRYLGSMSAADKRRAVIYTCGPHGMMHAVAQLAEQHGIDCQVCLEQAMACGMGTCQSCVVKIEDTQRPQDCTPAGRPWRFRLACTDGPVFDSRSVLW